MKKYILLHRSEISHAIGVGIGFLNFYILRGEFLGKLVLQLLLLWAILQAVFQIFS